MTSDHFIDENTFWQAVIDRDHNADGSFVYSVSTTGIYCRPSCPSRLPKRTNVSYHLTPTDAEEEGYRPCQRCEPKQLSKREKNVEMVTKACRLIHDAEEPPSLDELASSVGISKHHFHRIFKDITGLTPKAYADAFREKKMLANLSEGNSVTSAIYDAGFNSSSRFYSKSNLNLGMTPTRRRAGGVGETIRFAVGECSLGSILVATTPKGICSILLGDSPEEILDSFQRQFPKADLIGGDASFEEWVAKVVAFVDDPQIGLDLPLDIRGTAFQKRVWQALREIPHGETASYAEIAQKIGAPKAVRAVAGACASNKLAIAIPCHRVVKSDGALSGYRWGIDRKRSLLIQERAIAS